MKGILIPNWDSDYGVMNPKTKSGDAAVMGRFSSLQGLKVWTNKNKGWLAAQGYTHAVGIGNIVLCTMTMQEFYDLRKVHHVKRQKLMELKLLEGQIDAIRTGLAAIPVLQREVVRLKQELARM